MDKYCFLKVTQGHIFRLLRILIAMRDLKSDIKSKGKLCQSLPSLYMSKAQKLPFWDNFRVMYGKYP